MDQVVVAVGAVLSVGGLVVAAVVGRSQAHSLREITYVVLPIIGSSGDCSDGVVPAVEVAGRPCCRSPVFRFPFDG